MFTLLRHKIASQSNYTYKYVQNSISMAGIISYI